MAVMMNERMTEWRLGQRYTLTTDDPNGTGVRYTLIVVDSDNKKVLKQKTMGVFVVPLGLERELQITKHESQTKLLE